MSMRELKLNVDQETLDLLNSLLTIRVLAGAQGPVETMLVSILCEVAEGKDEFLIAMCDGRVVVEAL